MKWAPYARARSDVDKKYPSFISTVFASKVLMKNNLA
jgi:hypothetical protein